MVVATIKYVYPSVSGFVAAGGIEGVSPWRVERDLILEEWRIGAGLPLFCLY